MPDEAPVMTTTPGPASGVTVGRPARAAPPG
jgi:hypothetical protein